MYQKLSEIERKDMEKILEEMRKTKNPKKRKLGKKRKKMEPKQNQTVCPKQNHGAYTAT